MAGPVKIILTLPRCGTHFIWSRLVQSGRYQLIYDADRIPALDVLGGQYDGKLDFLCPPPANPNYNFQFNSLSEVDVPLSAREHMDRLMRKHSAASPFELFQKLMALQDNGSRMLFSINRFVYTCANDHFHGTSFEWSTECAMKALRLLHEWFGALGRPVRFMLVIRAIDDWIQSQMQRRGADQTRVVRRRLEGFPVLIQNCRELGIPVFEMNEVIRTINAGSLDFDQALRPLPAADLGEWLHQVDARQAALQPRQPTVAPKMFRAGRFVQYLREKDPIKRTSLVRSIGYLPVRMSPLLPVIGRQIRRDCDGVVLNNARIREMESRQS